MFDNINNPKDSLAGLRMDTDKVRSNFETTGSNSTVYMNGFIAVL
jgi:hypothetical protein